MSIANIFKGNEKFVPFCRSACNGRSIFIDIALIPRYIEITQSKAVSEMRLSQAIMSLRALAGGMNSLSNANSAFCHRTMVGGAEIAYAVLQASEGRPGGVYVTDVRLKANNPNKVPGLYNVVLQEDGWEPKKVTEVSTNTSHGVVSAGLATINGEAILDEAARDCANFLDKNATNYDRKKYHLYFTPGSKVDSEGTWITPSQKCLPPSTLAKELANVLKALESDWDRAKPITWYVLDDGAKVFLQALKLLPAVGVQKLTKSTFAFADVRESIASIRLALQNVGIALSPDMIKANFDKAAVVRQKLTRENGLKYKSEHTRLNSDVNISQGATNHLQKIEFFEEEVKKQLLGAAQGWC